MQEYPVYTIHAEAGGETGVDVEMRVQMGAGGGLPGMPSADVVAQALATAMTEAGAITVTSQVTSLQTAEIVTS